MTRINLVPPSELCDQHLLAEWRELTRIPNCISTGKYRVDFKKIPDEYTIRTESNPEGGRGHVTFFFDKLKFLYDRYQLLLKECSVRGFNISNHWPEYKFRDALWNDFTPSPKDINKNLTRIQERLPKRARFTNGC